MGPGITEHFSSRGAAFGDYDNDGDIDALILNMNDLPSLLRNDGGNKQNWIKIKLVGTQCNRTAIGARVRVVTGKHIQMDEVHSGTSVMSQCDLRLHFGLGKAETVDVIEVKWPTTQKIERFTQVKANQILTIREGEGIVATARPKKMKPLLCDEKRLDLSRVHWLWKHLPWLVEAKQFVIPTGAKRSGGDLLYLSFNIGAKRRSGNATTADAKQLQ